LQLISSQSLKLPAEAVSKLLDGCSHFASLRLHPSRVVTGSHVEWGSFSVVTQQPFSSLCSLYS
jgi:hypothetical protein